MQLSETAELAALLAAHGCFMISSPERIAAAGVEAYWTASKCRADSWGRALKQWSAATGEAHGLSRTPTPSMPALVQEILASEVLTRVWTGVLCAHDQRHGVCEAAPLARSIYMGHMEARQRVLSLLLHAPGVSMEQAVELNQFRQRTERWTDLLIGRLSLAGDVVEFASNPQRATEFAQDLREERTQGGEPRSWGIILASLRVAFQTADALPAPHPRLNERIAASIVACFQPGWFDATGVPQSPWIARLLAASSDTPGTLDKFREPATARAHRRFR